jgi:hypothetical protein
MANGGNLNECRFKAWTRILTEGLKPSHFLYLFSIHFPTINCEWAEPILIHSKNITDETAIHWTGWNTGKFKLTYLYTLNKYCLKIRIMWKWTTRKEWSILSTIWLQIEMSNSDVFSDNWQSERKEIWRVTSWPYCF